MLKLVFVRANNDFDDKLTAFSMKKKIWTKIPKNGHCVDVVVVVVKTVLLLFRLPLGWRYPRTTKLDGPHSEGTCQI